MMLTKSQKLIYDLEKYAGGSINVICGSMLLHGKNDVPALQNAVNELYRLNDAMRIRVVEADSGVSQIVEEYRPKAVGVLRFSSKEELDAYAGEYAQKPIDLYGGLCNVKVIILPDRYGILVKFHHLIGDAWSLALLCSQFNALLHGEVPTAYSYIDHFADESDYLQSSRYAKDRAFFLEQFQKCEEVTYLSEKQSTSFAAKRKTFILDRNKTALLTDYAKSSGTSVFSLFLAALASYYSRTRQNAEKFYLGTAVLNRAGVREKNTMGMFINSVPLLMELDRQKTFAENLNQIN